jgi:hypothetical protein
VRNGQRTGHGDHTERSVDGSAHYGVVGGIGQEYIAVAGHDPEYSSGWKNADFYSGRMAEPGKRELHQYLMDISSLNLQVAENPR